MYDKKIFANNLQYYMNKHDESQADIARLLGISKSNVTSYLAGKQIPRMDKVQALAEHFGIKNSDLLEKSTPLPSVADPDTWILREDEQEIISSYRRLSEQGQQFIRSNMAFALGEYPLEEDTSSHGQVG